MTPRLLSLFAGMAFVVAATGCSQTPSESGAPPHPVQGTVTFANRTPLRGGVIAFTPLEIKAGSKIRYKCENLVDAQGRYKMGPGGNDQGIPAGEYKVTLMPRDYMELPNSNSNQIPPAYRDEATTPLTYTVKEGDNTFDIEIK